LFEDAFIEVLQLTVFQVKCFSTLSNRPKKVLFRRSILRSCFRSRPI
jgi:hypothetical protein